MIHYHTDYTYDLISSSLVERSNAISGGFFWYKTTECLAVDVALVKAKTATAGTRKRFPSMLLYGQ